MASTVDKWCREHGVKIKCSIEDSDRGGKGLFYKYTTSEEILRVPRHLLLTKAKLRESIFAEEDLKEFDDMREKNVLVYILRDILNQEPAEEITDDERDAKMTKIDIIWQKYSKFLPSGSDINLPLSWSDDDVELLEPTSIGLSLYSKKHALSRAYGILSQNPTAYWAEQLVASRSLELPVYYKDPPRDPKDKTPPKPKDPNEEPVIVGSEVAMVPIIDLVNHSDKPNARYEVDPKSGDVILLSTVPAEERVGEVLISYSADDKGASEMLYNYGFMDSTMSSCKKMTCIVPLDMEIDEEKFKDGNLVQLEEMRQLFFNSPYGTITFTDDGQGGAVKWTSDFIWLWAVPTEDTIFELNAERTEIVLVVKGHRIDDPLVIEETLKTEEPEYFENTIKPAAEKMARERAADISEYLTAQQLEMVSLGENENVRHDHIKRLIKLENTTLLNFLVPKKIEETTE